MQNDYETRKARRQHAAAEATQNSGILDYLREIRFTAQEALETDNPKVIHDALKVLALQTGRLAALASANG